ncbi:methionyl-tRNA synthetase [Cordyceps fumosorosea ARSEF 2679]|uniref:Methionyl-tRNA synthetase n=1 Tax=Cordyceps fumosorosea (strain ARSEF 2679) TaxID=1081104 RepID=A0A168CPR8_CORFA|nr:methionyl-tRNA synthetase [Cordyceps fumosorosea ARSEF 2679]OAA71641.1 methionyl-tRNA synthetase [Cordyceps fumosorosea ARSEF 2679]
MCLRDTAELVDWTHFTSAGGTDEYGTTTEARALPEKCTPKELLRQLQTDITQDIFLKLRDNGFLKERITTQLYCEQHQSFLADRFVQGECPVCGYEDARGDQCGLCGQLLDTLQLKNPPLQGRRRAKPITKDTNHIFLELDKLQPEVEAFFKESASKGSWSRNSQVITSAWLKQGLKPRSITRDIKWGTAVPLPGYEDKIVYSWFDACIGYVSITAAYTDQWEQWWRSPNVELYQFIGKGQYDLTYEGGKFSKSRGIGVFGDSARKTGVPSDIWRSFLLSHRPETGDTDFTNNLLLKNLGNFVSRVLRFINSHRYVDMVPNWEEHSDVSLTGFQKNINQLLAQYMQDLDAVKMRSALATVLWISQEGNIFLQSSRLDNSLAESEPLKCAAVIGVAVNVAHLLASLLAPFMPDTAKSISSQLGADLLPIPSEWSPGSIAPGHRINKSQHLFSRIKPETAGEWRKLFGSDEVAKLTMEEATLKARKRAAVKAARNIGGNESGEAVENEASIELAAGTDQLQLQ